MLSTILSAVATFLRWFFLGPQPTTIPAGPRFTFAITSVARTHTMPDATLKSSAPFAASASLPGATCSVVVTVNGTAQPGVTLHSGDFATFTAPVDATVSVATQVVDPATGNAGLATTETFVVLGAAPSFSFATTAVAPDPTPAPPAA